MSRLVLKRREELCIGASVTMPGQSTFTTLSVVTVALIQRPGDHRTDEGSECRPEGLAFCETHPYRRRAPFGESNGQEVDPPGNRSKISSRSGTRLHGRVPCMAGIRFASQIPTEQEVSPPGFPKQKGGLHGGQGSGRSYPDPEPNACSYFCRIRRVAST